MEKLIHIQKKGFTLIELLIVIAVIGVLAAVVLTVINPLEQLAKSRDTGRRSTIDQLSKALSGLYLSNGTYPTDATWSTTLTTSQEIKTMPAAITGGTACATNVQNGYCYRMGTGGVEAMVFTRLESGTERAKCTTAGQNPYALWSSADSRMGVVCLGSEPTAAQALAGLGASAYR